MTKTDVIPAFLAVCPTIGPVWQEHLEFWSDESDRGSFNDAAVVARHLVESFERGDLSEFPAAFALLERCLVEGDEEAQNLATVGVIEGIQNIASHRPFGPQALYQWLGPVARAAWDELCVFWQKVAEAKAAGMLEASSGESASPQVEPSQVQDPALRRLIEQLYRK